jgi:ABC-type glycerol-3-phosphate transport system substrate-binding protein
MYGGRLGTQLAASAPELANHVTVIFPPWGPEKVTLGVWSRFAIAAGTQHKAEAKDFLGWLLSGDRLLRYDMTLPGHMIPPLHTVQAMAKNFDSPYVKQHADWIEAFNNWVNLTNHPAMNMGSMQSGHFQRSGVIPPWGRAVFGTPGVIDTMLQEITLGGKDSQLAWQLAANKMKAAANEWKNRHPDWRPEGCSGPAADNR